MEKLTLNNKGIASNIDILLSKRSKLQSETIARYIAENYSVN